MSKFVKGKVLECTLNKGFTYIKVQREVGEGYFVVRAKGDTSFEIGKSETFKGVTLNEKLTNEERKVYDLDDGIKESNTTWAPANETPLGLDQQTKPQMVDKPTVVSKADIADLAPYLNLMRMGMDVAIAAGLLQGVTDEFERDNIISVCSCGLLREAKKLKNLFETEV